MALSRGEHRLVDERQWLAAIGQQPGFPVARFAFAGIGLAVEIGIARQHHAAIGIVSDSMTARCRPATSRGSGSFRHARLGKKRSTSRGTGAKKGMASQ